MRSWKPEDQRGGDQAEDGGAGPPADDAAGEEQVVGEEEQEGGAAGDGQGALLVDLRHDDQDGEGEQGEEDPAGPARGAPPGDAVGEAQQRVGVDPRRAPAVRWGS
jgi:hypothetical protein